MLQRATKESSSRCRCASKQRTRLLLSASVSKAERHVCERIQKCEVGRCLRAVGTRRVAREPNVFWMDGEAQSACIWVVKAASGHADWAAVMRTAVDVVFWVAAALIIESFRTLSNERAAFSLTCQGLRLRKVRVTTGSNYRSLWELSACHWHLTPTMSSRQPRYTFLCQLAAEFRY